MICDECYRNRWYEIGELCPTCRMKDITEMTLEEQVQFLEDLRKKLEEEE